MIPRSDTIRRVGYLLIALAASFIVTHVWISVSIDDTDEVVRNVVLGIAFVAVLTASMRAAPRNGTVWALLWAAFFGAGGEAAESIGLARTGFSWDEIAAGGVAVAPSALDPLGAAALSVVSWAWLPSTFLIVIHLAILFPDGRPASNRWRWVAWVSGAAIGVVSLATGLATAPWVETRYDEITGSGDPAGSWGILTLGLMLAAAASVVHLVRRYRRSSAIARLQYRWVTWALTLNVVVILGVLGLPFDRLGVGDLPITLALVALPVSMGVAITRYRLFDIDIVISRSLLFVGLAGFITVIYAVVVVGVGSLVGGSSLWLSISATGVVAVAFEPVRHRLQRWINRLVYGQRATPYEVLSDLTGRLAATERGDGLLGRMAQRLREGTGADRAVVWVAGPAGLHAAANAPEAARPGDLVREPGDLAGLVVPIEHEGEALGALSVESRRGEALTAIERRLVEDLARSAGLFLRRRRLDVVLEQNARELAESRRRLVDEQDMERRRLESDLHDGPHRHIVALMRRLEGAARLASEEGSGEASTMIRRMAGDAREAIDQIEVIARGLYPKVLETYGLAAAISVAAGLTSMDIRVETNLDGRHDVQLEAAIYFCVSEALTNAVKHGEGPIDVVVSDGDGELAFQVSDSGPGFDPRAVLRGAGLNNMADRLDALGGPLTLASAPGEGTTVSGRLPLRAPALQ